MPELFADDIRSVSIPCSLCGTTVELANTGLSAFDSSEGVMCLDCLISGGAARVGTDDEEINVPLQERIAVIDEVVATFSLHLRNVLVRSVKSDLTWNSQYGFDSWDSPADALASAHAPGIWYGIRSRQLTSRI